MTQENSHSRRPSMVVAQQALDLAGNAVLLLALYFAYAAVRRVTADEWFTAIRNAHLLLDFQETVGLPSEAALQATFFLERPPLVRAANTFYMWGHFPITGLFLLWSWAFHRRYFSVIRDSLISLTLAGLVLHLVFPLAPPRFLTSEGFVDTGALLGPNPYDIGAAKAANQIAAMPSLHVGWAVLVAISVIALSTSRWRFLALLHPILTTSVVVLTANHYWTDAIIATLLVLAAWYYTGRLSNLSPFSFPATPPADEGAFSQLPDSSTSTDSVAETSSAGESAGSPDTSTSSADDVLVLSR